MNNSDAAFFTTLARQRQVKVMVFPPQFWTAWRKTNIAPRQQVQ
jgi:hypothetical protein